LRRLTALRAKSQSKSSSLPSINIVREILFSEKLTLITAPT